MTSSWWSVNDIIVGNVRIERPVIGEETGAVIALDAFRWSWPQAHGALLVLFGRFKGGSSQGEDR
jgi:hypothetical protein